MAIDGSHQLIFTEGTDLIINATNVNFAENMGSLSSSTTTSATLIASTNSSEAVAYYNVILDISENDFEYTTDDLSPELIITIYDPEGNIVTSAEGLNFVTVYDELTGEKIQGFDITEFSGLTRIRANYEIYVNEETSEIESQIQITQDWLVELTFVNLDSDQNANAGKTFDGSIVLTSDDIYVGTEPYIEIVDSDVVTNNYNWLNEEVEVSVNVLDPTSYGIVATSYCVSDQICSPDTILETSLESYNTTQTNQLEEGYVLTKLNGTYALANSFDYNYNITIDNEGANVLCVTSENAVGESSTVCSRVYYIDKTDPEVSDFIITGTLGNNNWYTSQIVEITSKEDATDETSGVELSVVDIQTITEDTDEAIVTMTTIDKAGNISTNSITVKKDSTAPSITGVENKTINKDDSINLLEDITCTDNLTDCDLSVSPSTIDTSKAGTTEVTYKGVDEAGNTTTEIVTITVDADEPDLNFEVEDGAINGNGWANEDFSVTIIATDNSGTGINNTKYCITTDESCTPTTTLTESTVTISTEGINTVCAITTDNNNKSITLCSSAYSLDKTNPTSGTINVSGTLGNNNWYTSNITVTAENGTDDLSGHLSSVVDTTLITEDTSSKTITLITTDLAGNTSTTTLTVKKDETKPTIGSIDLTGTLGTNSWYTSDVSITTSGNTDATSGIASATLSHTEITENTEGTTVTLTVIDEAGNINTLEKTVKIDKASPTLTASSASVTITEGDSYASSSYFTVGYSSSGGSIECEPSNTSTLEVGTQTLSCTATGNNGKATTTTKSITVESATTYLADQILLDEYNGFSTTAESISYINNKGTPDFSDTPLTDDGLYAAADDFGTSYYFRGAVEDNYVEFADMLWRIVRIDGEGNVKLMLYNESTSGTSYLGMNSGASYAFNSTRTAPYYVGYMYTASDMHGSGTSSTIKTSIDSWYTSNLSSYSSYISTTAVYCNDRSSYTSSAGTTENSSYVTSTQYYGAYTRVGYGVSTVSPSLECPYESDAFSVDDTSVGNGALTYGIAMVTVDEIVMAGQGGSEAHYDSSADTTATYMFTGVTIWALSPCYYSSNARVFNWVSYGYLNNNSATSSYDVFPAVSLSSTTLYESGDGSLENPYKIES